jgi:CRISPR-associated protein Cas1
MQLVINTPGTYLHVKEGCFHIKTDSEQFQIAPGKVQSIVLTTTAAVSTQAVKLACENNADIVFLDDFGKPYGRVWHAKMGSTASIRRRQIEASQEELGFEFAREWVHNKILNQIDFLRRLARARPKKSAECEGYIQTLETSSTAVQCAKGTLEEKRGTLMGIEGTAGRIYFEALSTLLPQRWRFYGRSRNPAKDSFNCMLNYAYGVLYSIVERACVLAGLDPHVGFLHTDGYGKKSFVFDVIEQYRIWAEETSFYLFSGRKVKMEMFDSIPGGLTLNKDGKVLLMTNLNERLAERIRHRGRNLKRRDIVLADCHRLANRLLGKPNPDHIPEIKEV